jgi:hypothetical protein
MSKAERGLYETLVTEALHAQLGTLDGSILHTAQTRGQT